MTGAQKIREYEMTGAQSVRIDKSENHAYKLRMCKIRADKTDHVSENGRMMELKSNTTIREIACVKMLTRNRSSEVQWTMTEFLLSQEQQ